MVELRASEVWSGRCCWLFGPTALTVDMEEKGIGLLGEGRVFVVGYFDNSELLYNRNRLSTRFRPMDPQELPSDQSIGNTHSSLLEGR